MTDLPTERLTLFRFQRDATSRSCSSRTEALLLQKRRAARHSQSPLEEEKTFRPRRMPCGGPYTATPRQPSPVSTAGLGRIVLTAVDSFRISRAPKTWT